MSSLEMKYRIHEFAKDIGTKSTEIIDLLNTVEEKERNHMALLSVGELDFLLNHYSALHAVENFDAFLESGKEKAKERAAKEAEAKAAKEAEEKAAQAKAAEEKAAAEKAAAQKAAEEKAKEKEAPKAAPQPTVKTPAREPMAGPRIVSRAPRPAAPAARPAAKAAPAKPPVKPAAKPAPTAKATPAAPVTPKPVFNPTPKKPMVKKPKGESRRDPADFEKKVRVVDTRVSDVNLGKYDEKLQEMANSHEARKFAGAVTKQKIVKKSNQKMYGGPKRRKESEAEKLKRIEQQRKKVQLKVLVPDEISVGELAMRMKVNVAEVVKKLMGMGVMASASQMIDFDTAYLVGEEFHCRIEKEVILTIEDRLIDDTQDDAADLISRSPVVVVMGHVDHGKTSLLDAIRDTDVAAGEAGGITQHIGAYQVQINGQSITFLDTPGHAAFTQMRQRGAMATDIAILVVAADDGVMPQTIEAINHAKAAEIPIIVAINKIDKPGANPDKVKQELTEYGLVCEDWGGDTIMVPVSAVQRQNIDTLLEMVLLSAEMRELKANPNRTAKGTVIEAKLDKGRGPVATVLVQNGTLRMGDILIAGSAVGKVRAMNDYRGRRLQEAGPSVPVEIIGMSDVPQAGDIFFVVEDERLARELAEQRRAEEKMKQQNQYTVSLDDLFSRIQEGNMKELNIIVKADVQGTAEAVRASLEKLTNDEVRVRVIHNGVGAINESDVMLAGASGAIIVGFNVRPDSNAKSAAERDEVDIRTYRVIYDCLEEIEAAMKGMLAPKYKEVVLGSVEVRQTFRASGVGTIAGCYVKSGKITRGCKVRLLRDNIVVFEGELSSLKRFKDDAKEVVSGYECGVTIENYNDIKEGDFIEPYEMQEITE